MNKYATVIGIGFILVSVFSAVTLAMTVDMYGAFAETKAKIVPPTNIYIKEVRVPPIYSLDENIRVTILLSVNNPTRLDIQVYSIEFSIWMFNKSTAVHVGNRQAMEQFYVFSGGSSDYDHPDFLIPSGGQAVLESWLTVTTPLKIAVLNTTDPDDGMYRPLVYADMRYEVVDLGVPITVRGMSYFEPLGVDPYVP